MQMLGAHVALCRESFLRLADHVYDALAKTLQVSLLINVKNYLILKTLQAQNARCHVCNPCAQNFDSGSFARTCLDWRGDRSQRAGQGEGELERERARTFIEAKGNLKNAQV